MACHTLDRPLDEARVREIVADEMQRQVRHCALCGTSPISRVVACTEVDCPAREARAA